MKLMWVVPRNCSICVTEGFSGPDLASIVAASPQILRRSLENHVIPSYNFLKSVVMVNENIVRALNKSYWLNGQSLPNIIVPNIEILKDIGVPMSNISFLVTCHPSAVSQNNVKFARSVKMVIEMGFDPLRVKFLKAVQVIVEMAESMWEHKMEVYRRWGLTDDQIMLMFRLDPLCMKSSEKKIMSVMDFLVNKMGWEPAAIVDIQQSFCAVLRRRSFHGCSVVKVLQMKGLVKKDLWCLFIVRGILWDEYLRACVYPMPLVQFLLTWKTAATPWIFPDGSSKAEFTECNMLGLLQCDPGNQEKAGKALLTQVLTLPGGLKIRAALGSSVLLMPGSFGIKWSHSFPWIQWFT
ncbi:hypothetical protein CK203_002825 [Vitis vinifera]|uniref:Uncharacterized protein n=1 Tax=Vitis vinifera TaxID=29760 RepID=A0A438KHP9_VITVI|nr:hypothetical protein CK203_002825 [Vitis vinifera]